MEVALTKLLKVACFSMTLCAVQAGLPAAWAQDDNRLTQVTALFDDAEPAFRTLATCRMTSGDLLPVKAKTSIEASLKSAGLTAQQIAELLSRVSNVKPYVTDDRPIAEAMLFCGAAGREFRAILDKVFKFAENLQAVVASRPGRDDTQVLQAMNEIAVRLQNATVCVVLESGQLPKRNGIRPDDAYGKELARFDISPPVRNYINTIFSRDPDFSQFKNVGALRAHCVARGLELKKNFDAGKKLPPPAINILKELKPQP